MSELRRAVKALLDEGPFEHTDDAHWCRFCRRANSDQHNTDCPWVRLEQAYEAATNDEVGRYALAVGETAVILATVRECSSTVDDGALAGIARELVDAVQDKLK